MNYLTYPLKVMNITQGYNDNYTHKRHSEGNLKDYPIDDACGSGNNSYFYCPCDEMVVKKVYGVGLRASNTIWLESTTPVITPTFTDYITIMIVHPKDKDLKNVYVGRKYKRNEALFPKGADGFATGPHFHITLGRGKMSGSGWAKNNLGLWILKTTGYNIKPEHGMFIDKNFTTIKNTRNIEFLSLNDEEKEEDNIFYTTANLNIRYGPGANYRFVNLLHKDTQIKIESITNGWAKINDKEYVASAYLTKTKPKFFYLSKITTAALLNVRNKPNGNVILYKIPKKTTVSVMKNENNWTQIYNNRWVYSKYLN
ncbi:sH3 domain protein [Firmicutes bacterium CAG:460]|nr:sH3 domain protein [Firmicutes bacterium CAG:460]